VSTTGRDLQAPRVSPATVAEWRRRQDVCSEIVPPLDDGEQHTNGFDVSGDADAISSADGGKRANGFQLSVDADAISSADGGKRANGFQVSVDADAISSLDTVEQSFSESQQAGIAAMLRIARAAVIASQSLPATAPPAAEPEPEPPTSPRDHAPTAALAQPVSVIAQSPVAERPATAVPDRIPPEATQESRDRRTAWSSSVSSFVPVVSLAVILIVQAVLSLKLTWSNTAFSDEALYLWAGHLELAHWLHGTPIPAFPTYFSGAPVIYPPLGALADSLGGLAGARILSLCFILGATALLWATTSRLFGHRAGFFAAGLWAFLGPTLHLSAFATFDAMSLFFMALSTWCIVRAGPQRDAAKWMFAAACALAISNATAYSSAIADPIIVLFALLVNWPKPTRKFALMRATALGAYTVAILVLLVTAGGGLYMAGIGQTVLDRVSGKEAAVAVLHQALIWIAPVAILAAVGLLICAAVEDRIRFWPLVALASAAMLITVEQARLHTGTSLDKHVDFGAWMAAIVAGYAVSKILCRLPKSWLRVFATIACACTLVVPTQIGLAQARATFASWPNATSFIAALRPLADQSTGPMLVEDSPIAEYYLPAGHDWQRWSNTFSLMRLNGRGIGPGVGKLFPAETYVRLVNADYFTMIALNFGSSSHTIDQKVADALESNTHYHLVRSAVYGTSRYLIWIRVS
jgi:4-amino-4-deoxy-L-arabinose transferase-like glycosyltransferase